MDLEFHDAPPTVVNTPQKSKYKPFFDAVKANPGKWAKYPDPAPTSVSTHWRRKGFKIANRAVKDSKADLWACWPADEAQS